jgi:replicative DNA helicase
MPPAPNNTDLERTLLAALCSSSHSPESRKQILNKLSNYTWHSPDHRVIYESLRRSRQQDPTTLREFLTAEATRLGFPDIDIAPYFSADSLPSADIEKLIATLLAARSEPPPRT